jgi:hypothetical protein
VSVKYIALRQDVDDMKISKDPNNNDRHFSDYIICRSRSEISCPWAIQMSSWLVVKQNHDSSSVTISCHDLAVWMQSTQRKACDIPTLVYFWHSDKMCDTHWMCSTMNLRTFINRLWIVDLEIWVSLLMSLTEENSCSARTAVIASLISSRASIHSSAGGRLSGPELCLTQV